MNMNITHIPSFDVQFDQLNQFLSHLVEEYKWGNIRSWEDLEKRVNDFFTQEEMDELESLVPGWEKMSALSDGVTLTHVMCVFLGLLMLAEYQVLTPEQQQLAKWIVLFHDVQKEVEPGKRDPIHAFRSAITTATNLPRFGFVTTPEYNNLIHPWSMLTYLAITTPENVSEPIQDNGKLPEILSGIDKLFGENAPAALIVKGVLLHMSINVVDDYPQAAPLSKDESAKYINKELLPLLKVMMLADNEGWVMFYPEVRREQYNETVNAFDKVEELVSKQA